MIRRRHASGETESEAVYSDCEGYRYALARRWGPGAMCLWIMLNPSTATEARNDPTIARCEARTRRMGFGAMAIGNLFALRATRPAALRAAADPVGTGNDRWLRRLAGEAGLVVCGWGVHGALYGRDRRVLASLPGPLSSLGVTRDGHPRHPLYVGYSVAPSPFPPDAP